jgi:hypothetical protein
VFSGSVYTLPVLALFLPLPYKVRWGGKKQKKFEKKRELTAIPI